MRRSEFKELSAPGSLVRLDGDFEARPFGGRNLDSYLLLAFIMYIEVFIVITVIDSFLVFSSF